MRAVDTSTNPGPYGNTSSASTPAAPSGLVAAYAFDEGSGTTVSDASGNGNGGTISGATWSSAGKYGSALSFNGSSSRVTIANSSSLQLSSGMTLEAWVDPATVSSAWRDVIEKGNDNYFLMGTTDQSSAAGGGGIIGGSYGQVFTTSPLATNTWSFLALTYDGATERLYLNGTQVASLAHTGAITSSTNALTLGSDPFYGQFFNGLIDNIRIYNSALSAAAIQSRHDHAGQRHGPDTTPPSAPGTLTATAASSAEIDLSWGAATDNVGIANYQIWRCQGTGCSNFSQVGTTSNGTTTSYQDTGLSASTSYSYEVRAVDTSTNPGPYSNIASATTKTVDNQPPTAPGTLTATAVSSAEIDLSWGAATDNVGIANYQIWRCQGTGCSNFSQVGTTSNGTTASYQDTGLSASTSYTTRCARSTPPPTRPLRQQRLRDDAGNRQPAAHGARHPHRHRQQLERDRPELGPRHRRRRHRRLSDRPLRGRRLHRLLASRPAERDRDDLPGHHRLSVHQLQLPGACHRHVGNLGPLATSPPRALPPRLPASSQRTDSRRARAQRSATGRVTATRARSPARRGRPPESMATRSPSTERAAGSRSPTPARCSFEPG